jgi:hypothetical protein
MLKEICQACYGSRGYEWGETAESLWEGTNEAAMKLKGVCCCAVNDAFHDGRKPKSMPKEREKSLYKSSRLCDLKTPPDECVYKLEHTVGDQPCSAKTSA